jgi:hypothetical protein
LVPTEYKAKHLFDVSFTETGWSESKMTEAGVDYWFHVHIEFHKILSIASKVTYYLGTNTQIEYHKPLSPHKIRKVHYKCTVLSENV